MYKSGSGVPRDLDYAARLFRRACDKGEALACYSLGYMYANGEGVDVDMEQAGRLFRSACDSGDRVGCEAAEQHRALARLPAACAGLPGPLPRAKTLRMLLTRAEMSLDFRGERLDPARDREILRFIFNQFLYGEVTGIQVGHWLYDAPDLDVGALPRQAGDRGAAARRQLPADHAAARRGAGRTAPDRCACSRPG